MELTLEAKIWDCGDFFLELSLLLDVNKNGLLRLLATSLVFLVSVVETLDKLIIIFQTLPLHVQGWSVCTFVLHMHLARGWKAESVFSQCKFWPLN
jgi:hypothetical protein